MQNFFKAAFVASSVASVALLGGCGSESSSPSKNQAAAQPKIGPKPVTRPPVISNQPPPPPVEPPAIVPHSSQVPPLAQMPSEPPALPSVPTAPVVPVISSLPSGPALPLAPAQVPSKLTPAAQFVAGIYRPYEGMQVTVNAASYDVSYFILSGSGTSLQTYRMDSVYFDGAQYRTTPSAGFLSGAKAELVQGVLLVKNFTRVESLSLNLEGAHLSPAEMATIASAEKNLHHTARLAGLVPELNQKLDSLKAAPSQPNQVSRSLTATLRLRGGALAITETQVKIAESMVANPTVVAAFLAKKNFRGVVFSDEACGTADGLCAKRTFDGSGRLVDSYLMVGSNSATPTTSADLLRSLGVAP